MSKNESSQSNRFTCHGVRTIEWFYGLISFFLVSLFGDSLARLMPFMLLAWLYTTFGLAFIRIKFVEKRSFKEALKDDEDYIQWLEESGELQKATLLRRFSLIARPYLGIIIFMMIVGPIGCAFFALFSR